MKIPIYSRLGQEEEGDIFIYNSRKSPEVVLLTQENHSANESGDIEKTIIGINIERHQIDELIDKLKSFKTDKRLYA